MAMEIKGIGPQGTSLLHKMGTKRAYEMSDDELLAKITAEQTRRSFQRAVGRTLRIEKDHGKRHVTKTLEQLGIDPAICERMRESFKGVSEASLIQKIQKAGLL